MQKIKHVCRQSLNVIISDAFLVCGFAITKMIAVTLVTKNTTILIINAAVSRFCYFYNRKKTKL